MNIEEALDYMLSEILKTKTSYFEMVNPAEVAAFLVQRGFLGKRNSICGCPVAVYLQQMTGDEWVSVSAASAESYGEEFILPDPIMYFVEIFDMGGFPELVLV